ncbi:unnamed protein product [Effrenium voratum]|uniref:Uncharacterized protein n=1 Tax=Effrenium voratum TaxID=2562239 RepID=A0AA36I1L5_9DINO|nr:unnamed protein product [Effrenium voratum]CAJ1379344.1 unnamed protein product [Effrenium voratum]
MASVSYVGRRRCQVLCLCAGILAACREDLSFVGAARPGLAPAVRSTRPRIVRQIQTYDAFENIGQPFDVYAVFFVVSCLMLVVLFIFPFATNFGRSEQQEEEDVELLYEEVDDDDEVEDLYEEVEEVTELKKEPKEEQKEKEEVKTELKEPASKA